MVTIMMKELSKVPMDDITKHSTWNRAIAKILNIQIHPNNNNLCLNALRQEHHAHSKARWWEHHDMGLFLCKQ